MITKFCFRCNATLPIDDFSFNKRKKDGRTSSCKICHRKQVDDHYQKNKQYYVDKAHKSTSLTIKWIQNYKEVNPCVDCGQFWPFYVMDFDHLRDKEFNISQQTQKLSRKKLLAEIEKCEIVCANCHRKRTYERQTQISEGVERSENAKKSFKLK